MMIDNIIKLAYKKIDNLKSFNIHDCLYFTEDVIDSIYPIFNEAFKNEYGVKPNTKIERYEEKEEITPPMAKNEEVIDTNYVNPYSFLEDVIKELRLTIPEQGSISADDWILHELENIGC